MSKDDDLLSAWLIGNELGRSVRDSWEQSSAHGERLRNSAQISTLNETVSSQDKKIARQRTEVQRLNEVIDSCNLKINSLRQKNTQLMDLLDQPVDRIAEQNSRFSKHLDMFKSIYLETLEEWAVSQKAYRELAMGYGEQLGKSEVQIRSEAIEKEKDVRENKTAYGNNLAD